MVKILVIEDEPVLRQEILAWLSSEHFETRVVEAGILGVETAFHYLPDLIICGISLPQLDGFGVLLELRANPITVGIPFIFITAKAAHNDFRKGIASEIDDYITKPFTRMELLQAIQSRLQKESVQMQEREREIDQLEEALAQEREKQLLKAKLIAMFSHDFRNPLTSILASNTLLSDYADRMDEQRRRLHLNRINASVRQLIQMLDDMLLTMQMDTGNLDFKPIPINAEQLFQGIVEEFQTIYGETHQVIFESHIPKMMTADPRLLQPIAANLISNAIKYLPQGGEVRVTLDSSDDQFTLTVQDQGIGVPEADQSRLFTPFQRGSNVGDVKGTGLGLAIIKQAVDLHGGSIHFESQVKVGTTIIVMIPIRPAN